MIVLRDANSSSALQHSGATGGQSGRILLTALAAVPQVLAELGVAPAVVLAESGLTPEGLGEPANRISYTAMGRLFNRCVALTGCQHFGLLVGAREGLSNLGAVGFLVQHSPDVGTALRNLVSYMHHHQRGAVPTLATNAELSRLGYVIYQRNVVSTEQICDGAIAVCANILRTLCGPGFQPRAVSLSRPRPADPTPYRQVFGVLPQFSAEECSIAFPTAWLGQPVPDANPMLYRILQRQVQQMGGGVATGLAGVLRGMIRTLLIAGRCSADEAATLFGVHRRTLHRRLKAEGQTFEGIVDTARFELAQELLSETQGSLAQIAGTLGYAETSAFSRAFRRWSGATPTGWRERDRAHRREPAVG